MLLRDGVELTVGVVPDGGGRPVSGEVSFPRVGPVGAWMASEEVGMVVVGLPGVVRAGWMTAGRALDGGHQCSPGLVSVSIAVVLDTPETTVGAYLGFVTGVGPQRIA